jgi:hypothetical protein
MAQRSSMIGALPRCSAGRWLFWLGFYGAILSGWAGLMQT